MWALTDGNFHVTEAMNRVDEAHPVYKKHAEQLSNALHSYPKALADGDTFHDAVGVGRLWSRLGFTAAQFINRYTSGPMQDR